MDNMTEMHTTQVDLSGLMEVLGKNLYSTPAVALRELIQNAHDAIRRRRIEDDSAFEARITLHARPEKNQLVIEDNGAGLTKDEIVSYLATVGSGYTRQLRQSQAEEDLIGYFGLGFLSAYVVAKKVEVITTSYQSAEQTHRFTSRGGERFSIEAHEAHPIGTRVILSLSESFEGLSDPEWVRALVQKYCCMLQLPIVMRNETTPINALVPPWRLDEDTSALQQRKKSLAFASAFERHGEPLAVIPVTPTEDCAVHGLLLDPKPFVLCQLGFSQRPRVRARHAHHGRGA